MTFFGMVKWPFSMVKWPPARGLKGHFESPGIGCLLLCFSLLYCFDRKHLATDSEDQLLEMENSSRPHLINFFFGDAMLGVGGVHVYVYIYIYLYMHTYSPVFLSIEYEFWIPKSAQASFMTRSAWRILEDHEGTPPKYFNKVSQTIRW